MTPKQFKIWLIIGITVSTFSSCVGGAYAGVVEFTMDGCQPCQQMKPIVAQAKAMGFEIEVVNISRVNDPRYNGGNVPQFVVTENGNTLRRMIGRCTLDRLTAFIRGIQ